MSRVNHADTLVTELRELRRRLRLLEAARSVPAGAAAAVRAATGSLVPTRPVDWVACTAAGWEELFGGSTSGGVVALRFAADAGTAGSVRVVVDGSPVGAEFTAGVDPAAASVSVAGGQVGVQARVVSGGGAVRVFAVL